MGSFCKLATISFSWFEEVVVSADKDCAGRTASFQIECLKAENKWEGDFFITLGLYLKNQQGLTF